ncbi:MAG: hypothetical protein P1U89_06325 [Verrucomicrobiales bacterium]|nr:hypothetical protein [Verrucomicrobiales bacterium]
MKFQLEVGKRSQLSRGGSLLAGLIFLSLGIASIFVDINPTWVRWVFCLVNFAGLGVLVLWTTSAREEIAEEDLIEIARQSIQTEAERLDGKRLELERVLMSYGEWMEFPEFGKVEKIEWKGKIEGADQRITQLLDQQSDKMLADFSTGIYWEDGKFQTRKLLIELFNFMEQIAQIYNPDAEKPILETNLESLLKAINRASLQTILLLEELPLFDVKEMNIRKASDAVRKASKVYRKYEEIQPLLQPVRYLWQGSKFLFASNPLLAAGWIAGSELLWKGGKKMGKKAMDAYLLSLMRQSLGILAWETAGIYDKTYRYRNPDWIYGLEIVHFASLFEPTPALLRSVFKELGAIPLRSSYDRIFLYRCTANHVSPKPGRFGAADWLPIIMAQDMGRRLIDFSQAVLNEEDLVSKRYEIWRNDMEVRIGVDDKLIGDPL